MRTIKVASVQMDVTSAPVQERLANEAAQAGAQLIAFPEVFNTGYAYSPENYVLAETLDGPTLLTRKNGKDDETLLPSKNFS